MSTLDNTQIWPVPNQNLSSKYEKCLNITEEIYKRINITFQIKKLETGSQSEVSEHSDQIDSNDLSNETDLFACDKSDSIPSSDPDTARVPPVVVNINNNTVKKAAPVYKRPKKKFRKRVKKRSNARGDDSDASSDDGAPLSHCVLPSYVILTKDVKPKILSPEKNQPSKPAEEKKDNKNKELIAILNQGKEKGEKCSLCSMSFKAERGLRRHMAISHNITDPACERQAKPA